jgi:hypothetical protein
VSRNDVLLGVQSVGGQMDQEWVSEAESGCAGGRFGAAATFQITAQAITFPGLAQTPAPIRVLARIKITRKLAVRAAESCRSTESLPRYSA